MERECFANISTSNLSAATAIKRIVPSASYMLGGDHCRLDKVVKLNRDLISTTKKLGTSHQSSSKSDGSYSYHYMHSGNSRSGARACGSKPRGSYGNGGRSFYENNAV